MADPGAPQTPLTRSGLTQAGRRLPELDRAHFVPDERDLADLVMFGQRFAAHIQFYDPLGARQGDWRSFFESDITAALAALSKLPLEALTTFQLDLERWLKAVPQRDPAQLATHLRLWFHLALVPLELIAQHHSALPPQHPLKSSLPRLVARDLAQPLQSIAGWYKGALIDTAGPGTAMFADAPVAAADLNLDGAPGDLRPRLSATIAGLVLNRPAFGARTLSPDLLALLPPGTWPLIYAAAALDSAPYEEWANRYERLYDALSYNLLTRAVERLLQGARRIKAEAASALAASLTDFAEHPAHFGLWLSFLRLFRHAQGELNRFTGRHLDFYFRDVLGLQPRAALPDHAHLTFELAKGVETRLLSQGTSFRAGKDALGRPVSFDLDDDIVVNRARVASLAGLTVATRTVDGRAEVMVRTAPVLSSADGSGEVPLPPDAPSFPPFGPPDAPAARLGFALADRRLFLREGSRTIVIRAALRQRLPQPLAPAFTVRLSGADGWFSADTVRVRIDNDHTGDDRDTEDTDGRGYEGDHDKPGGWRPGGRRSGRSSAERDSKGTGKGSGKARTQAARRGHRDFFATDEAEDKGRRHPPPQGKGGRQPLPIHLLEITVILAATDPAVIPIDPALHGSEHAPGLPVAEVIIGLSDQAGRRAYAALRDAFTARPTLMVTASGVKALTVLAAGAEADPAKPFTPFGPRPRPGDTLILGSSEIFSKPIESWGLTLDWLTPYSSDGFFAARAASNYAPVERILSGGVWVDAGGSYRGSPRIFGTAIALGETNGQVALRSGDLIDGLAEQTLENPVYDGTALTGFLKLTLDESFGHAEFPTEQARAMMALAQGDAYVGQPDRNYDPPGSTTIVGSLPKPPYDPVITRIEAHYTSQRSAVERFRHLHPFGTTEGTGGRLLPELPFEGALYVGVQEFTGPARLTLLVQVEDGSGDPLLPVPELEFSYLDGDRFMALPAQDVDDKTANLTTSGIIGLALPVADTDHAVMPGGLTWLRIAAPRHAAALNRLLTVTAQAARVSFADAGNDPARLATPLPPGAISRTLLPDTALKTVAQPFAGFGGRPAEAAAAMDTRVAERLRHKDRATTMWDVEALVLDQFPSLYRVKCLGLTELRRNAEGIVLSDNPARPGAVTVVAVPTVSPTSARNPLRPYVDQSTLVAVAAFLRPRLSPFVRLEVTNPRIEEVRLDFRVRFAAGVADTAFYIDALNAALVAFLTPWSGGQGGEITFGGKLWRSTVIDFLDERPEVDFVTEVQMFHKPDVALADGDWTPINTEVVQTTSARSILVSAPRHTIAEVA